MGNTKTPRFQQRHYEAIAEHINRSRSTWQDRRIECEIWISLFKSDNPKFSADKFIAAACDDKKS